MPGTLPGARETPQRQGTPPPSAAVNLLPLPGYSTKNLTLSWHHIDFNQNTSLSFHPVIPRYVSVTVEPGWRVHHEPSCLQLG